MILPSLLNICSLLCLLPAPTVSHAPYLPSPAIFVLPVSVPPTLHASPASPASLGQMRTTSYAHVSPSVLDLQQTLKLETLTHILLYL